MNKCPTVSKVVPRFSRMGRAANQALVSALLSTYELIKRSGILSTPGGRRMFETCYGVYKRHFEARHIGKARRYVRRGDLVIDVGANIGVLSEMFAQWVGLEGRVIAIEPEPANVAALRRRIASAKLEAIVEVIAAAAGDRGGPVFLRVEPNHPGDHHLVENGSDKSGVISVDSATIDQIVEDRGGRPPSLIKIDVQGAEAMVLRGARNTLLRCRPALLVELDQQSLARAGSSEREIYDLLYEFGYIPHDLRSGRVLRRGEEASQTAADYADVLFLARSTSGDNSLSRRS